MGSNPTFGTIVQEIPSLDKQSATRVVCIDEDRAALTETSPISFHVWAWLGEAAFQPAQPFYRSR